MTRRERGVGRRRALLAGAGALTIAVVLLGWLALQRRQRPDRSDGARESERAAAGAEDAEDVGPVERLAGDEIAADPESAAGAEASADPVIEIPDRETAVRYLLQALRDADRLVGTDLEVLDADRLLSKALLANPDLAAEVAGLLPELTNRKLAFRIGLMLGRYRLDPKVHAALLAALTGEEGLGKEVAAYAFYGVRGDVEAASALANGFASGRDPQVRAAHAFALSTMIGDLDAPRRDAVRTEARTVIADTSRSPAFRAEALSLLDPHLEDRARLRDVLTKDPSHEVVMAAARILARAGEDQSVVTDALRRVADEGQAGELVTTSIRAMLADFEERYEAAGPPK